MDSNSEIKRLVEAVSARAASFLASEADISVTDTEFYFHDVKRLNLDALTSIISVEGHLSVLFAFSLSQALAEQINLGYTKELQPTEQELEEYLEETLADMINVILGNVLTQFQLAGEAIHLSPPVVISEAKNICRNKQAKFMTSRLNTSYGVLDVYCIGPKELFDQKLNYIEEGSHE